MRRKKIPVHTDELGKTGVSVTFMDVETPAADTNKAHRDEYYVFFLQQKGSTLLMLDFDRLPLDNCCLYFIRPGQVHQYLRQKMTGWFLELSPDIIEKDFRNYLDKLAVQTVFLKDTRKLATILKLLDKAIALPVHNNFETKEIKAYVSAFMAVACDAFSTGTGKNTKAQSRQDEITAMFKQLVKERFRTLKRPADYARLLHISPAYLNEILTGATGFSTSYWIQQELFLEAKRLLYHTELSAKEIAFELGFEDHTYFARLFKKVNGQTPGSFRQAYRDLSN